MRAIRHAWLTEQIRRVHAESRATYGGQRMHAELTLGLGIAVGHGAETLMRRAGLPGSGGAAGSTRPRQQSTWSIASSPRDQPDRLWVTDITEHPTREG
ncbi:IS3 family transposase [Actinomadura sp. B10D3]|uniref:IS3 family transposase n=1 Tax=Actinomadura sp. B10D3 TaxID=3153557 RepID=UPI00325C51B7